MKTACNLMKFLVINEKVHLRNTRQTSLILETQKKIYQQNFALAPFYAILFLVQSKKYWLCRREF